MKATGIVRRIDELGRIVIPKEIRRTLRIRESDPMEIYTSGDGSIVLQKYSPVRELGELAREYVQALNGVFGHTAAVCDTEWIVAAAGQHKKTLADKAIAPLLREQLLSKTILLQQEEKEKTLLLTGDQASPFLMQLIVPILVNGDVMGGVLLCANEARQPMGTGELQALKTAALYLARQLEG